MSDFSKLGKEYQFPALHLQDLEPNPFVQFNHWITTAIEQGVDEPHAMTLATVSKDYQISARMMLLKYVDEKGFVFFSNYTSHKATDLNEIPTAALVFFWPKIGRQIRIEGTVEKVEKQISETYFNQRSVSARCAAMASKQSQILESPEILTRQYEALRNEAEHTPPKRPEHWGGYRLIPSYFEFWQGQPHRLHHRFSYQRIKQGWTINRLYP